MLEEKIIDSKGCKYISEFMDDLPENVLLNKVITGCGMTSVILENDVRYVLAVPYVSLVKNKNQWCKERGIKVCAAYYGGANENDIMVYQGNKIITTYDSLAKVTNALEQRGDLKEWKICIDEAHKLVDSAAFRPGAINSVLDNYKRYKCYVFGTATPVKDKYQLPSLKHISKMTIQWNNLELVKVNYCHYDNKINDVVAILALDFINGERIGNAHIFINSVKSICEIIRKMQKGGFSKHNDIRIVCANNPRNLNLIETKTLKKYCISPVGSGVKRVNFYTSTAFEGCDIYDEEGKNFIVTDGAKDYTKIDIVTVLPQIIGRVRNSKYNNTVDLLYTSNQYMSDMTEEQFEIKVHQNMEEAKKDIVEFNQLRPESTHRINAIEKNDNPYLLVDGDQLLLNENSWYNEMHNFSTLQNTYFVSKYGTERTIMDGTKKFNGVGYEYKGIKRVQIAGLNKVKLGRAASFKDLCIDYIRILSKENSFLRSAKIAQMKEIEPLIVEAYSQLGPQKMKALEYSKKKIEEALLVISNESSFYYKVVKLLNLRVGEWYSMVEIKSKLVQIYKQLHLNKAAKGTDLSNWFDLAPKNKRIKGKLVSGIVVTTCNVKLT
tara:strand:- start:14171 stop:15991 length:1821 start_codon:yes stop_codon:yes gene_type:complete